MAGKGAKSKHPSALTKFYIRAYNILQVFGWSYLLYQLVTYYTVGDKSVSLWDTVKTTVIIFQNAAVLEIFHAATGIVPSNVIVTTFQVLSRVMVVCGVILATPPEYAASSYGLPLALLAWSITEIIRYLYYFLNLVFFVPQPLVWLRYTTFIVLYPIGVSGELWCFYDAVRFAGSHPEARSYALPNSWNFTFSYLYLLVGVMLLYIPLFPKLYMHMFSQRRKILGPTSPTATSKKVR